MHNAALNSAQRYFMCSITSQLTVILSNISWWCTDCQQHYYSTDPYIMHMKRWCSFTLKVNYNFGLCQLFWLPKVFVGNCSLELELEFWCLLAVNNTVIGLMGVQVSSMPGLYKIIIIVCSPGWSSESKRHLHQKLHRLFFTGKRLLTHTHIQC